MKIDIYQSTLNGDKYLAVPAGTKMDAFPIPENFDTDVMSLSPFRTRLELDPKHPQKALDQAVVMHAIESKGFAIFEATFKITLG